MTDHIKDFDIKKLLSENGFGYQTFLIDKNLAIPDGYFKKDDVHFVIEYENSSRGLSFHIPKWLRVSQKNNIKMVAILICSPHHIKNHKNDRLNAICLAEIAKQNKWSIQYYIENDPGYENIISMIETIIKNHL